MLISVNVASEKIKYAGSFCSFANSNLIFFNSLKIIKSNSLNFSLLILLTLETLAFFDVSFTLARYFLFPFNTSIPSSVIFKPPKFSISIIKRPDDIICLIKPCQKDFNFSLPTPNVGNK